MRYRNGSRMEEDGLSRVDVARFELFLVIRSESVSNSLIRPCHEEIHPFRIRAQVPFVVTSKASGLVVGTYQGDLTAPIVRVVCTHTSQLGEISTRSFKQHSDCGAYHQTDSAEIQGLLHCHSHPQHERFRILCSPTGSGVSAQHGNLQDPRTMADEG